MRGGTGSRSELEEQPDFLPDMCESGTLNAVGIAGLFAGVRFVLGRGVDEIRRHEVELAHRLIEGLSAIPGVTVYGGHDAHRQTATVSFNIGRLAPSEVGLRLDEEYGILCRVGLHCAPAAHKTIGTFPTGTVRFGLAYFNSLEEVERAVEAVRDIWRGECKGNKGASYGVVLFYSTNWAIKAEKVLQKAGLEVKLIPVPRHLSSDCGVALRFERADEEAVCRALKEAQVEIEGIHKL